MKATIFLLFISTSIATASRADFDRRNEREPGFPKLQENLNRYASPKRQGTNNRNQQRFDNPSEIKTIVLACDQDKDGQLNSKEFEECVSIA